MFLFNLILLFSPKYLFDFLTFFHFKKNNFPNIFTKLFKYHKKGEIKNTIVILRSVAFFTLFLIVYFD